MIKDLNGKTAVVTGGAAGIGLCAVKTLLAQGMKVVCADVDRERIDNLNAEMDSENFWATYCDVSSFEANELLAQQTASRFGGVNLVVFNAATLGDHGGWRATDMTQYAWRKYISVNLDGPFYGFKAFWPHLLKQEEAHMVFVCSAFSLLTGLGDPAPYFATKAGLLSFTECLYFDLISRDDYKNVGLTAVLPGNTQNKIYDELSQMLAETEDNPDAWENDEWGTREYCQALIDHFNSNSTPPDVVIDDMVEAIKEDRFYVTPNIMGHWKYIKHRWDYIENGRNPTFLDKSTDVYRDVDAG